MITTRLVKYLWLSPFPRPIAQVIHVDKCNTIQISRVHSSTSAVTKSITVLGIETSCDDTSVAILQKIYRGTITSNSESYENEASGSSSSQTSHAPSISTEQFLSFPPARTKILFHKTISSDNRKFGGIHPLISLESHRTHLAKLVKESLDYLPVSDTACSTKPDLVAATRGPGMRSSLAVGLDTAKGLSVAWGVPFVGVNHMQGHALTPRLVSSLEEKGVHICMDEEEEKKNSPEFPFLTLLVSGGHTMLLSSQGLTRHGILANTIDLAIGDMLDKCARVLLPKEVLAGQERDNIAYGKLLEEYVFQNGEKDWNYVGPKNKEREIEEEKLSKEFKWWPLPKPFEGTRAKHNLLAFSFSGLGSVVERVVKGKETEVGGVERRALGREVMKVGFEHLGRRVFLALKEMKKVLKPEDWEKELPRTLVVSGGVASNKFLRHLLKEYLIDVGYPEMELVFPPPSLCTDNAAMIAWAGLEMYEAGWETDLNCHPLRKWSLDEKGEDGGILGVGSWERRTDVDLGKEQT